MLGEREGDTSDGGGCMYNTCHWMLERNTFYMQRTHSI
jgi:hypothetical protein